MGSAEKFAMPISGNGRSFAAAALTLLILLGAGPPSSAGTASAAHEPGAWAAAAAATARQKVLVTIENRMSDDRTREKMREKLGVLDGRKLRLAAALCDRIARDGDTAGADIAFSLVTALIVLS